LGPQRPRRDTANPSRLSFSKHGETRLAAQKVSIIRNDLGAAPTLERGFEREIKKRLEYWARLRQERGEG
jgi:hypothetical protein